MAVAGVVAIPSGSSPVAKDEPRETLSWSILHSTRTKPISIRCYVPCPHRPLGHQASRGSVSSQNQVTVASMPWVVPFARSRSPFRTRLYVHNTKPFTSEFHLDRKAPRIIPPQGMLTDGHHAEAAIWRLEFSCSATPPSKRFLRSLAWHSHRHARPATNALLQGGHYTRPLSVRSYRRCSLWHSHPPLQ
jgi:hypothetical protein